jgi:hypothetical protein
MSEKGEIFMITAVVTLNSTILELYKGQENFLASRARQEKFYWVEQYPTWLCGSL